MTMKIDVSRFQAWCSVLLGLVSARIMLVSRISGHGTRLPIGQYYTVVINLFFVCSVYSSEYDICQCHSIGLLALLKS